MPEERQVSEDLIVGKNPVLEALRSDVQVDKILLVQGGLSSGMQAIISKAKAKNIPIKTVSKTKLDFISNNAVHQGVAAYTAPKKYCSIEDILNYAKEKNEDPFVIICDGMEDPHNLGAIIRTAEAAGAHGIIIPKNNAASLTHTTAKASSGAFVHMNIARVTNITNTIKALKQSGLWIYCADMDGSPSKSFDLTGAIGLVVGSEGKGISRLVKENCDGVLSLPMKGKINSLNASVAAGILMYDILRQKDR